MPASLEIDRVTSRFLPAPVRGVLTSVALGLNTLVMTGAMVLPALVKLAVRGGPVRAACDRLLNGLASAWVGVNNAWIAAVSPQAWDVELPAGLHRRGWYLVSPNHRSWVDIVVLQRVFHDQIPFLKFFLKKELIWVPVIGLAWWALDFPFMARGKGRGARQNDLKTTRQACEKFKRLPTTVINFLHGTRFTPAKHAPQGGSYRHLLEPKFGGIGVALATMGDVFEALLDVTLVYPDGTPTFWDLLCGRCTRVIVRVKPRPIPAELIGGDPLSDKALRQKLKAWVDEQWREKDELIDRLLADAETARRG